MSDDLGIRNVEWVCENTGLNKETVYKLLRSGEIPAVRLGKHWFVHKDVFQEMQTQQMERRAAR